MAFKTLPSLETDTIIGIDGKRDKKTGKVNPTSIEGYYLGGKKIEDGKNKRGYYYIHVFLTPDGNTGVWGKTNLDNQLTQVTPGTMVRASFVKMVPTKNGEMYKFKVEVDTDNTTDVSGLNNESSDSSENEYQADLDSDGDGEDYDDTPVIVASQSNRNHVFKQNSVIQSEKVKALLSKSKAKN